jgi:hypothetical protein
MVTITVQYVTMFSVGKHGRQPRQGGSSGFTLITGAPTETLPVMVSSGSITTSPPPSPATWDGVSYTYAFTSVSDGTSASQAAIGPINFPVGGSDITILYVFIPPPGPPGHGSGADYGATIDAFDTTTGSLVDNFFITQVNPDDASHDNQTEANQEGYVDTTGNTVTMVAYAPTIGPAGDTTPMNAPTSAQFVQWLMVPAPVPTGVKATGPKLTVPKATSIYALALYYIPKPAKETPEKPPGPEKHLEKFPPEKNETFDKIAQDNYKSSHLTEKQTDKPFVGEFSKTQTDSGGVGLHGASASPSGVYAQQMHQLTRKITDLETKLATVLKGKAFIKEADRPVVGKPPAKKAR